MAFRETWTMIPDYSGHEVSKGGQIRNIASGTVLQTSINQTGVRYVSIRNTTLGKYENRAVSVLVAATFCEGRSADHDTVLHLNGNTEDVSADNLMWSTRYNAIAYHKEINDERFSRRYRLQDGEGNLYKSIAEAAKATGCLPSAIDYSIRYNNNLAIDENVNFVHRIYPGGHVFRGA